MSEKQATERALGEVKQEVVGVLRDIAEQALAHPSRYVGAKETEDSLAKLLDLGFVRSSEMGYEITETGFQFLEENKGIDADTSLRIRPSEVITQFIKDRITVVVPVLNEADGVARVIEEIEVEGYENILVVDGYSTDRTAYLADTNGAKVVYQHGSGKAGAVKTAIERVKTPYMLFMDGDCTYDPKDIWRLMNHSEHYSQVIGARDRQHIPRVHRFGNWVISQVFSVLFNVKTTDVCSGMYLLETEEARKYTIQEGGFIVEIELAAQSASTENLTEVPISYRPRIGTRKLNTWSHGLAILSAAFRLARRYNPILLYSGLAGLSIAPAALILAWVVFEQLTRRIFHSGWALAGMIFLFMAVQAFTLASVSILQKHSEKRLMQEIRSSR